MDCVRRIFSTSKKPPAIRKLKIATPASQASTSQGRASIAAAEGCELVAVLRAEIAACAPFWRMGGLGKGTGFIAMLELLDVWYPRSVKPGAASIRTSPLMAIAYRVEARRQSAIDAPAIAASAVPCHRKCSSA